MASVKSFVLRFVMALAAAGALASCQTTGQKYPYGSELSISIPYNPYDFDPAELEEEAQAHCNAYGLRAVYVDETIDPKSVRWRYRHYHCV